MGQVKYHNNGDPVLPLKDSTYHFTLVVGFQVAWSARWLTCRPYSLPFTSVYVQRRLRSNVGSTQMATLPCMLAEHHRPEPGVWSGPRTWINFVVLPLGLLTGCRTWRVASNGFPG